MNMLAVRTIINTKMLSLRGVRWKISPRANMLKSVAAEISNADVATTVARHFVYGVQRQRRFIKPIIVTSAIAIAFLESVFTSVINLPSNRSENTGVVRAMAFGILLTNAVSRNEPSILLLFGSSARSTDGTPMTQNSRSRNCLGLSGKLDTVKGIRSEMKIVKRVFIR